MNKKEHLEKRLMKKQIISIEWKGRGSEQVVSDQIYKQAQFYQMFSALLLSQHEYEPSSQ